MDQPFYDQNMRTPWMDPELRRRWRSLPRRRRRELHRRIAFGNRPADPEDRALAVDLARHRRHQLVWVAVLGPPVGLVVLWALQPLLGGDTPFGEFVTDPWNWLFIVLFLWIGPLFEARKLKRVEQRNADAMLQP